MSESWLVVPLLVYLVTCQAENRLFSIRKLETLTSTLKGSGMDKPSFHLFGLSNGGTYSVEICDDHHCCRSDFLNTEDNNWNLGQTDWFVGSQISNCNGFQVNTTPTQMDNNTVGGGLRLTLLHTGSNSGRLEYIRLHSWHTASSFLCPIDKSLDHTSSVTVMCEYQEHRTDQNQSNWCNGAEHFCTLQFNQFLFPGSHNAGTGQSDGFFKCAFKNHDLSITEQLDFGIRYFDIDTILSSGLSGCEGLEAGHGANPELGLYQCYGKVEDLLNEVKVWMDEHRSEVIILNFGGIEFKEATVPALVDVIKKKFESDTGVRLNTDYKTTGNWPTLQSAVEKDARVFVFVRDPRVADEKGIIEDRKMKPNTFAEKTNGAAVVLTSYKGGEVGDECAFVLNRTEMACNRTDADFIKLALYSKYFMSGVDCLWHIARICNRQTQPAITLCKREFEKRVNSSDKIRFAPNFVMLDYPNYQGTSQVSFIQILQEENFLRAELLINQTQSTKETESGHTAQPIVQQSTEEEGSTEDDETSKENKMTVVVEEEGSNEEETN